MEINITWNICRVCLVEEEKKPQGVGGVMEPLRHLFSDDKQLPQQIFECSGIMMKPNDKLPEKICKNCLTMVKHAVNFRKTCRASDTYLQALLQRTRAASLLFNPEKALDLENDIDNCEDALIATEPEDEVEQFHTQKEREAHLEKSRNKLEKVTHKPIVSSNTDELIVQVDEEPKELHHDLNELVEIEEEMEHSETGEKEMFNTEKQNSSVGEEQESVVSNSYEQDFQATEVTTEDFDDLDERIQEAEKHNNEDFYCLPRDTKHKNILQTDCNIEHEDQIEIEDQNENEQFISFDEEETKSEEHSENAENAENADDDSQAHVSSTVVTRDEFMKLQEQSFNISNDTNDLPTEYIVDEYCIDDSNSSTYLQNSSSVVVNVIPKVKKSAVVVYPERKAKFKDNKSATRNSISSEGVLQRQVWACDICGNNFANRHILKAHIKVHRQEKNHECEICLKRFITACNLQAHMRIHTGEKPFECQYCDRRFSDRSSNLRHERVHTNEKPFQCTDCGKSFSLSTTLKKHLKVHTGERFYRCEICAKSFKLPHQLKAHKKTTLHKAVEQLVFEN